MRNALAISLVMISLACDANVGSVAVSDGGSDTGGGDGDGDGGDPVACIGGLLCPEGTSCSNGVCETECSSDGDCDGDEYCGLDGLCHPNVVPTCNADIDCEPTQACVNQICTVQGDGGCDLQDYIQDGCPSNAVCIEDETQPGQGVCYQMPACGADQTCPIGLGGSVCNTGQLPSKDAVCLVGLCDVGANCPEFWMCVRYDNSVLGVCSDGGFGAPCAVDMHCLSGNCVLVPGLGGGFCG